MQTCKLLQWFVITPATGVYAHPNKHFMLSYIAFSKCQVTGVHDNDYLYKHGLYAHYMDYKHFMKNDRFSIFCC